MKRIIKYILLFTLLFLCVQSSVSAYGIPDLPNAPTVTLPQQSIPDMPNQPEVTIPEQQMPDMPNLPIVPLDIVPPPGNGTQIYDVRIMIQQVKDAEE